MFSKTKYFVYFLFILSLFAVAPAQAENDNPAIVSVSGTGTVSTKPDIANIAFGVRSDAKTAREALTENNRSMASVINALINEGIAEKDLQTSGFNIQPVFVYPKRSSNGEQEPPRVTGYTVTNNISVRVRDLGQTGKILDMVVSLGVNSGGNISFANDDTTEIFRQAREKAVKDAIAKAETLASAAGVKLGKILNISENTSLPRPQQYVTARAAVAEDSGVPIASGEETYRVDVQINWEIEQ